MTEGKKTKKYRKVKVKGFKAVQHNDGDVEFEPSLGVDSYYDLTKDSVDVNVDVQVRDMRTKMMLQEQKTAKIMQFLPVASNLISAGASVDPSIVKKLDFVGMIEQSAEALDMDLKRTIKLSDDKDFDLVQREHMAMLLQLKVPVPEDESFEQSLEHKKQHERFKFVFHGNKNTGKTTVQWDAMNGTQKDKWKQHYEATLENIRAKVLQTEDKTEEEQPPLAPPIQPVPSVKNAPAQKETQTPGAGRNLLPSV
jgi:hypothetical protein